jgi:hypothetical protein
MPTGSAHVARRVAGKAISIISTAFSSLLKEDQDGPIPHYNLHARSIAHLKRPV